MFHAAPIPNISGSAGSLVQTFHKCVLVVVKHYPKVECLRHFRVDNDASSVDASFRERVITASHGDIAGAVHPGPFPITR